MAFRPSEGSFFRELVLFAGPDGSTRLAYAETLAAFGFRLDTANTAQGAFDRSIAFAPDAVVALHGEAAIDSLALGRLLKRDPRTRDIPYIAVGLSAADEHIDSVLAAECLPETLGAEIRRLLAIARENRLRLLGVRVLSAHGRREYFGGTGHPIDRTADRAAAIRERVSSRFRTFLKAGAARCPNCGGALDDRRPSGTCPRCGQLLRLRG
jgi:CheY-like chemotaxis protein